MANPAVATYWQYAALNGPNGYVPLADNDPIRGAYGYSVIGMTPGTTATDVLTLSGSATKTVRVRQIVISGTATAATNIKIACHVRSTANTGGTSTNPTPAQRDMSDDTATAVLTQYSANPSALGTSLGPIDGGRLGVAATGAAAFDRFISQYSWLNEKGPVLRGTAQSFAINLTGAAVPAGMALDIGIWWTEE